MGPWTASARASASHATLASRALTSSGLLCSKTPPLIKKTSICERNSWPTLTQRGGSVPSTGYASTSHSCRRHGVSQHPESKPGSSRPLTSTRRASWALTRRFPLIASWQPTAWRARQAPGSTRSNWPRKADGRSWATTACKTRA